MQAANTGLTEGSTPSGNDYDREIVIISTLRLDKLHLLDKGEQVLAFPGTTLYSLEKALKPLGREPHSVIGSSCIGASVIGGICNNSGGSLVQRGPAYTEMSLFAQIDENGKLRLVNHLGIDLGATPEQILSRLDDDRIKEDDIQHDGRHAHDHDYVTRVRDVNADTPARYNADPDRLFESSGCAGKLAVFAARLDTFPAEKRQQVFYIGSNNPAVLTEIRRHILAEFQHLPVAGEYMHRDIYDIAERYGKDTFLMIDKLGTDKMPFFFTMKGRTDAMLEKVSLFKPHFTDRFMQKLGHVFPAHLPERMKSWRDKYEHHLLLKMAGDGIEEAQTWLTAYFREAEGDFLPARRKKAAKRFFTASPPQEPPSVTRRYMPTKWKTFWRWISLCAVTIPSGLSICRRRSTVSWYISSITVTLCATSSTRTTSSKRRRCPRTEREDAGAAEGARGAIPRRANVGHLYEAPESLKQFYRQNDPTNSMNPGLGKTSKQKYWGERQADGSHGAEEH